MGIGASIKSAMDILRPEMKKACDEARDVRCIWGDQRDSWAAARLRVRAQRTFDIVKPARRRHRTARPRARYTAIVGEPHPMQPGLDLRSPLSLRSALRFPLQSPAARRDVLCGALWLLLPGVGWLLNMGHRIVMVHRMQHGQPPTGAWREYGQLLKHGSLTALGMLLYAAPGLLALGCARASERPALYALGGLLLLLALLAIPGYMSHYCRGFDPREIFSPWRALCRVRQGGARYWQAWGIALVALALSFAGLLLFGVGFLLSSVWFWQVAGFAFASAFTQRFALDRD